MGSKDEGKISNIVLREIMEEIRQEKRKRVSFPFWGNLYGNWYNWANWTNWANWLNWWT